MSKSSNNGRQNIVMFRLEPKRIKILDEIVKRDPVVAITSGNQLARKIVVDFLEGRLQYTKERYKRFSDAILDQQDQEQEREGKI